MREEAANSRLSFEGRCMAAALACGDGVAISHRSAAAGVASALRSMLGREP